MLVDYGYCCMFVIRDLTAAGEELAMAKKAWKKPEVKHIEAGAAEKGTGSANDGAANKS